MKLSLVVLLGALTLGISSVANANTMINWIYAKNKLDCPMTCRALEMYVIMGGTDHKDRKPISVCTTKKGRDGEWLVGYNRWKETTCIVSIGEEVYRGERYYCLCTTHGIQPLR
ncbi:MAG: hypothetical protein VSS75_034570 [Candidatus Parabeggiatoa sp.]|nr:hypothetical protein [Candidatus Parabeggiatoa sp.]